MARTRNRSKRATRHAATDRGRKKVIRELNDNDVMLGRGLRPNQYIGNTRLHELVKSRKEEYLSTNSYNDKAVIGREVYEEITARGGRFLFKQVSGDGRAVRSKGGGAVFTEAPRKVGEERCKQMLREKGSDKEDGSSEGENHEGDDTFELDENGADENDGNETQDETNEAGFSVLTARVPEKRPSTTCDTDLLGLEGIHFPEISRHEGSLTTLEANVTEERPFLLPPNLSPILPPSNLVIQMPLNAPLTQMFEDRGESTPSDEQPPVLDGDTAESFLSALGVGTSELRFSLQDEVREKAALTEEEQTSILADMFGDKCSITEHRSKRQRRDIDGEHISFLLNQMRVEIGRLPAKEKEAFVEAQRKCRPEEFSDARLTKFLRCDGMNAQLAAARFVRYWRYRREVFGQDKFTQRMTLSEALCDDVVALKAGVFTLLPNRDLSGRHLLLIDPQRHSPESYESASMVRAFWYLVEIMVQEGGSGFVLLVWLKNITLFDFDRNIFLRLISIARSCCFPGKRFAAHIFCPPTSFIRMLRPIFSAAMDKEGRCRRLIHNVPDGEIVKSLEPYGITSEMLPLHMGGSVQSDGTAWIANRRSIEMEEIE